jgi:Flp pilus assembly protein TadG
MNRSDEGSITIWMLGLSVLILLFGGLALDYWRALALQRELSAVADSAAIAAASGLDEEAYRADGDVLLDPVRARNLAQEAIAWQDVVVIASDVEVEAVAVTVTLTAALDLGLLGLFVDESEPLTVRASATASPVLIP